MPRAFCMVAIARSKLDCSVHITAGLEDLAFSTSTSISTRHTCVTLTRSLTLSVAITLNPGESPVKPFVHQSFPLAIILTAGLTAGLPAASARAGVVVDVVQGLDHVTMFGSGTFNLAGWTETDSIYSLAGIDHDSATVGPIASGTDDFRSFTFAPNITVPGNLPPAIDYNFASEGNGDRFGFITYVDGFHYLFTPPDYASGEPLFGSATFDNTTIAEMGLTPGEYTWTWSTPAAGSDFFTVRVVPEPASLSLLAVAGLCLLRRRRMDCSVHRTERAVDLGFSLDGSHLAAPSTSTRFAGETK